MANPKGKFGRSRTRKRRSAWKASAPGLVPCPQCHEMRLPHRVCPACGYYDGRAVVNVKEG